MTNGALDRTRFETIEAYVLGTMSDDDRARFESALALDTEMQAEVDLMRESILAIELNGVSRVLREVASEGRSSNGEDHRNDLNWKRFLRYAAVIAVVVTGALVWWSAPSASERLFAEYYVADPGLPVSMGSTSDPAFADAMVAYKLGDYAEARTKWGVLLQTEPVNDTLRFYVASASLAMDDASAAIPILLGLVEEHSAFHDKSRWFLFLAYLRINDQMGMRSIGLDEDPIYGDRARLIKSELGL
jgi:hypothetical protein